MPPRRRRRAAGGGGSRGGAYEAPRARTRCTAAAEAEASRARTRCTVAEAEAALASGDSRRLRAVAAVRGLGADSVRRRAWPALLGVGRSGGAAAASDVGRFLAAAQRPHRDAAVVDADVARSLWHFAPRASEGELNRRRAELKTLLNGVVGANPGVVHYYQGLHDVASVLLLTLGLEAAFGALEALALTRLREFVKSDLSASLERLELLPPLLRRAAPELQRWVDAAGTPPHFALSWLITWFAHDCRNLAVAKRCFDLFLALPEHAPLYVAAALLRRSAPQIMEGTECDPAEVHRALSAVPVFGETSVDDLAVEAIAIVKEHPPDELQAYAASDAVRGDNAPSLAVAPARKGGRSRGEAVRAGLRQISLAAVGVIVTAIAFRTLDADGDGSVVDELTGYHLIDLL